MAGALRDAFHVDRSQLALNAAARGTVGVLLPLVVGALTGHLLGGLTVAIGAQHVAFTDRPGPYRLRLIRLGVSASVAAVAGALGILVGGINVAAVVVTLFWAFGAGLLVALGPSAKQVGITGTVILLVLAGRAQFLAGAGPGAALAVGVEILAGGLLQALLAVSGWLLRGRRPERMALAGAYRELADAASSAPGTAKGPPLTSTINSVQRTIRGVGRDRSAVMDAFRVLLDEAERIRIELVSLYAHAERLEALGANAAHSRVVDVLDAAATVLRGVAGALEGAGPPARITLAARRYNRAAESLRSLADQSGTGAFHQRITLRAASARAIALGGQLRAAVGTASTWRYASGQPTERTPGTTLPHSLRFETPVSDLWANITPKSAAFRHASRLAICLAACDGVVRAVGWSHGYWLPLTALIVLQPDFATTLSRGLFRIGGTLLGLALTTGLLAVLPGSHWSLIILAALAFFCLRSLNPANYGFSVIFLTALVIVLLAVAGVDPSQSVGQRGVYTLAGGLIAMGVYLLWPTWERSRIRLQLGALLDAYADYLRFVADPEIEVPRRESARSAARVARTNAEASLDRFRGDLGPVRDSRLLELADGVLANSNEFVHAAMRWEAARQDAPNIPSAPALDAFAAAAGDALDAMSAAVRAATTPRDMPDLRAAAEAVAAELQDDPAETAQTDAALVESTDRIADSLNTLGYLLRTDTEERAGASP
ncbi:MAG: FUSC family protein [Streptosporangiales bacterium]